MNEVGRYYSSERQWQRKYLLCKRRVRSYTSSSKCENGTYDSSINQAAYRAASTRGAVMEDVRWRVEEQYIIGRKMAGPRHSDSSWRHKSHQNL